MNYDGEEYITPIWDRTLGDVNDARENPTIKSIGAYNAEDLNRIQNNTKYVAGVLHERGIYTETQIVLNWKKADGKDWEETDIVTVAEMNRIIQNVIQLKEYSLATCKWIDIYPGMPWGYVAANAIERDLEYIRTQEIPPPETYELKLNSGVILNPGPYYLQSTGYFEEDTIVQIQADAPPLNKAFNIWSGSDDAIQRILDGGGTSTDFITTLKMWHEPVELTAEYNGLVPHTLVIGGGSVGEDQKAANFIYTGRFYAGEILTITSNIAKTNKVFHHWEGDGEQYVTNKLASTTTFTMPNEDISIQGIFAEPGLHEFIVYDGVSTTTYWKEYGEYIYLSAKQPGKKYTFNGWTKSNKEGSGWIYDKDKNDTSYSCGDENTTISARWQYNKERFTCEIINGNGSGVYFEGDIVNISPNNAAAGYKFDYWNVMRGKPSWDYNYGIRSTNAKFTMPIENVVIASVYKLITYGGVDYNYYTPSGDLIATDAAYDMNDTIIAGNIGCTGAGTYDSDNLIYIYAPPKIGENWFFEEWAGDITGIENKKSNTTFTRLTKNVTHHLRPRYRYRATNVYRVENGTFEDGSTTKVITEGDTVRVIASDPASVGKDEFWYWSCPNTSSITAYNSTATFTAGRYAGTIVAVYKKYHNAFIFTYSGTDVRRMYEGQEGAINAYPAPEGKMFSVWTGDTNRLDRQKAEYATTTFTMGNADMTLAANYVNAPTVVTTYYTITVSKGTINGGGRKLQVQAGTVVTIVADEAVDNERFVIWSGLEEGECSEPRASTAQVTVLRNMSVRAYYYSPDNPDPYVLTVIQMDGSQTTYTVNAGTTREIYAGYPPSGNKFWKWTATKQNGENAPYVVLDKREANSAVLMPPYPVTVRAWPIEEGATLHWDLEILGGPNQIPDGMVSLEEDEEINIYAGDAQPGFKFNCWRAVNAEDLRVLKQPITSANNTVVMPDRDIQLRAEFIEKDKFSLNMTCNIEGVDLDGAGNYNADDVITVSANIPDSMINDNVEFTFNGWTGDTTYLVDKTKQTTTLVMPNKAVNIVANFIVKYRLTITDGTIQDSGKFTDLFLPNEKITIESIDMEGQRFVYWSSVLNTVSMEELIGKSGNPYNKAITITMPNKYVWVKGNYTEGNEENSIGYYEGNLFENTVTLKEQDLSKISGTFDVGMILFDKEGNLYYANDKIDDTNYSFSKISAFLAQDIEHEQFLSLSPGKIYIDKESWLYGE